MNLMSTTQQHQVQITEQDVKDAIAHEMEFGPLNPHSSVEYHLGAYRRDEHSCGEAIHTTAQLIARTRTAARLEGERAGVEKIRELEQALEIIKGYTDYSLARKRPCTYCKEIRVMANGSLEEKE